MALFRAVAVYIVIYVLVSVLTLGDTKTGTTVQPNAWNTTTSIREMKKGSRLRMHRTSGGVVLGGKPNETSRTARDAVVGTPVVNFGEFSKRGQSELPQDAKHETNGLPYGVAESPAQFSYKYGPIDYSSKLEDGPGEKYYYSDLGTFVNDVVPKAEHTWNDMPDPGYISTRPDRHPRRRPGTFVEKNSCRQYLEFLKYAFEQIDKSARKFQNDHRDDYYDYYDNDYSQREPQVSGGKMYATKPPPVIIPDMAKLRSLAFNDNYGTENTYSYVRSGYMTESESVLPKVPETHRRMTQSTLVPLTSETVSPGTKSLSVSTSNTQDSISEASNTESTDRKSHLVTDSSKSSSTTEDDPKPIYHEEAGNTTAHIEEDRHDGCQDKLFPCPDNVNVTYPVNGYCNRFVVCESGKPNSEFCQEGLHFNLITGQCDLPQNSFCTYSCPREKGYFGIPGVCGGFFRCSDWFPEYRMCPPRMHWDLKAKICTFQELSSCPLKCEEPYQVKPYNGDCSSYIICTRGKPRYYRCPDGMNFDRKLLKCLSKAASNCIDDEDYITRNRGIENGRKALCAKIELEEGKSRWCQDTTEYYK